MGVHQSYKFGDSLDRNGSSVESLVPWQRVRTYLIDHIENILITRLVTQGSHHDTKLCCVDAACKIRQRRHGRKTRIRSLSPRKVPAGAPFFSPPSTKEKWPPSIVFKLMTASSYRAGSAKGIGMSSSDVLRSCLTIPVFIKNRKRFFKLRNLFFCVVLEICHGCSVCK